MLLRMHFDMAYLLVSHINMMLTFVCQSTYLDREPHNSESKNMEECQWRQNLREMIQNKT
jgi:predicted amidophosphoribosyltransferase